MIILDSSLFLGLPVYTESDCWHVTLAHSKQRTI